MPGPLLAFGVAIPAFIGLSSMFRNMGGGMNERCDNIMGGPERHHHLHGGRDTGTLLGGLTGGLLGLGGGLPGMLFGGLAGGVLGGVLGNLFDRHREQRLCHEGPNGFCGPQYPPPGGCAFGGPSVGCYGPPPGYGYGGPQFPGYGPQNAMNEFNYSTPYAGQQGGFGYPSNYGGGAYQQGYQQGYAYGEGYREGYREAMQQQQGGCWPPQNCYGGQGGDCRPQGQLTQEGEGKPITYTTSGGWQVTVDHDKVIAKDPSGQHNITWSGDPHEYVDGKHVKDWDGKERTMILPDGTKITAEATAANGLIQNTSIYDGNRNVQIDNNQNSVTHTSANPWDTRSREAWQPDGETAMVSLDRCGLGYTDVYTQDQNLGFKRTYKDISFTPNTSRLGPEFYPDQYRRHFEYA